ncbi:hypothetical protein ACFPVY_03425 [Flavobacterium qiangtangense]|uniref:Uncharacterized protein n=1 Tax=Flavobacterium qiangtangense TaxID=1442595 RepID=A0ABW1PKM6_9FLAO
MNWQTDKEIITQKYFELINFNNLHLFGILKDHIETARPILPLIEFVISRLETVVFLATDNRLWDADIVMRSALETFTKFLFITKANPEEQAKRIQEYWYELPEIASIKLSDQARRNLEFAGDSEIQRLSNLPLILSEEDEKALREKWTKSNRQRLEQKWSFSEMILWISKSDDKRLLEAYITLTHTYRMGSHIMHGDETGVSIIKEREGRFPEERQKAETGHYLRMFSDCLSYCCIVGMDSMVFINMPEEVEFFFKNAQRLNEIEALLQKYEGQVFEDPDYDKYR